MTEESQPGSITIKGKISNVDGQAAIGKDIKQDSRVITFGRGPTPEELAELATVFASFRDEVAREAPPEVKDEAVRQAEVIEAATKGPKPDLGAIATARRWFLDHAPKLFGAVTAVIANPIIGKIVQSAGDAVADEFKKRFPDAAPAHE
ncbi:MAG TPA: hypothetical protein VFV72_01795 [Candidatus Limnocylindrales bacterium]|nr:hypothetical protein [Candidatus Limnocylindrales bacterium]